MKITCISDTHCRLRKITVPESDLLIHAGDLTFKGDFVEIDQELRELGRIAKNFRVGCILVPGNHDWLSEKQPALMEQLCRDYGITYLCNSGIEIEGVKFWGSPVTPFFLNWAWNKFRGEEIKRYWDMIPKDTCVLVTHGPPKGILDYVESFNSIKGDIELEHVGCVDLYNRIQELKEVKLHIFGHLHSGYGLVKINNVTYINASINTEDYKPINEAIIVNI